MAPDEDQEVSIGQACRAVPCSGVPCNAMRRVVATGRISLPMRSVAGRIVHIGHIARTVPTDEECAPYSAHRCR